MKKHILSILFAVLSLFAVASAVSACGFFGYQPRVPKSLI
jgi:cyclic lactone autoinducer peptide